MFPAWKFRPLLYFSYHKEESITEDIPPFLPLKYTEVSLKLSVFKGRIPHVRRLNYTHSKKWTTCSGQMKTALNNVLLPTLFKIVNNIVQHCYTRLQASSGSTTCSVLLTTLSNVGSKTLFNAAFIRPEQVVHFWLCSPHDLSSQRRI